MKRPRRTKKNRAVDPAGWKGVDRDRTQLPALRKKRGKKRAEKVAADTWSGKIKPMKKRPRPPVVG
jgi:hypothetical protein